MPIISSNPSSIVSAGTWAAAANVYTSNDTYATNTGATQNAEYPLDVGGFDFSAIPAGSTINTVTVTIEARQPAARSQMKAEMLDGTTVLTPIRSYIYPDNTIDTFYTFQPVATLAQLQSATLKVRVTCKRVNATANTMSVDWVKIDVNYTAGATATGRPKPWVGGAHTSKPGKVWTGSSWVEKPWKSWTGSGWKVAK